MCAKCRATEKMSRENAVALITCAVNFINPPDSLQRDLADPFTVYRTLEAITGYAGALLLEIAAITGQSPEAVLAAIGAPDG